MGSGIQMKDGTFHELDILVLATGFHADKFIKPTSVIGRDGLSLDTFWTPRPSAHYAVTLPRFPNMFMLNGPTGPVGNFSLIDIAERQWDCTIGLRSKGRDRVSVRSRTDRETRVRRGTKW